MGAKRGVGTAAPRRSSASGARGKGTSASHRKAGIGGGRKRSRKELDEEDEEFEEEFEEEEIELTGEVGALSWQDQEWTGCSAHPDAC